MRRGAAERASCPRRDRRSMAAEAARLGDVAPARTGRPRVQFSVPVLFDPRKTYRGLLPEVQSRPSVVLGVFNTSARRDEFRECNLSRMRVASRLSFSSTIEPEIPNPMPPAQSVLAHKCNELLFVRIVEAADSHNIALHDPLSRTCIFVRAGRRVRPCLRRAVQLNQLNYLQKCPARSQFCAGTESIPVNKRESRRLLYI